MCQINGLGCIFLAIVSELERFLETTSINDGMSVCELVVNEDGDSIDHVRRRKTCQLHVDLIYYQVSS